MGDAPDVLDQGGRARRLVLSLIVGAAVAAIAFFICDRLARPDEMVSDGVYTAGHVGRAYNFVYYTTALFGALAFSATLATTTYLAKRAWRRQKDLPAAFAKDATR